MLITHYTSKHSQIYNSGVLSPIQKIAKSHEPYAYTMYIRCMSDIIDEKIYDFIRDQIFFESFLVFGDGFFHIEAVFHC